MRAAALVADLGYQNLYNVEDGFTLGWKPKGLPSCDPDQRVKLIEIYSDA